MKEAWKSREDGVRNPWQEGRGCILRGFASPLGRGGSIFISSLSFRECFEANGLCSPSQSSAKQFIHSPHPSSTLPPSPTFANLLAVHVRSVLTKNKAEVPATPTCPHTPSHTCACNKLIPNQTIQGLLAGCVSFGCPGVTPRSSGIKPFSLNIFE